MRLAIRQVPVAPVLTGSLLLGLLPASHALTLGDISVRSTLGQRLDATVPVRLGAGESLAGTCIVPGFQGSDLRHVPDARVTIPEATREGVYEVRVTSDAALYEPMYELELAVQCPGAPILVRQYVLMLDLPGAVASGAAQAPATVAAPVPAPPSAGALSMADPPPANRPRSAPVRPAGKIAAGSRYRVAEGDTLSAIAARVQGRDGSLQAMADAIQAANPAAFIRNDANLIKLGSEITIPETTSAAAPAAAGTGNSSAASGQAAPVTDMPVPALPQLPDTVTRVPAAEAPAAAAPAVPVATQAIAAQAKPAAPASAPSPVEPRPARAEPSDAREAPAETSNEPNPVVAAGAGIVFGLLVSALLWFRGRLPARKQPATAVAPGPERRVPAEPAAFATMPAPLVTRATEPGFSVSFTPAADDPLAAEFADYPEAPPAPRPASASRTTTAPAAPPAEDITSELEGLFDGTDTTIRKRLEAEKTMAARTFGAAEDDYVPAADGDVDFLVGDATGEEATMRADTLDQPRPDLAATAQSPTVDLRTLASSATKDEQQAQTLLEALTLLERDYEEELTASQVLDMSAVRDALGRDLDEPTQINDARLREASARKKYR